MTTITLDQARVDLAALIDRALAGEEIVIATPGAAAVKLAPVVAALKEAGEARKSYRGRGILKGQLSIGPEFFEPLSDEECGLPTSVEAK
jgi:antitoxin (DNA-binding transcriptional repressor) of toxin-antitoxin stability system